jgi:hypothetical protein
MTPDHRPTWVPLPNDLDELRPRRAALRLLIDIIDRSGRMAAIEAARDAGDETAVDRLIAAMFTGPDPIADPRSLATIAADLGLSPRQACAAADGLARAGYCRMAGRGRSAKITLSWPATPAAERRRP